MPNLVPTTGTDPSAAPGPAMDPITSILTGLLGIGTASGDQRYAENIGRTATAGTEGALAQLTKFMSDPNAVTKMPGYQFGMDQGLDAVNRGAGASGMLNSGNRLVALQNQGQAYAGTWMDRMYNQLTGNVNANVAGGKLELGAGELEMQGRQNKTNAQTGGVAGILSGLFGGGTSSIWNSILKSLTGGVGGDGTINTNVPNNTVPSGFTPGNSDVPPATDWPIGFGGDNPVTDPGFDPFQGIDLGQNF